MILFVLMAFRHISSNFHHTLRVVIIFRIVPRCYIDFSVDFYHNSSKFYDIWFLFRIVSADGHWIGYYSHNSALVIVIFLINYFIFWWFLCWLSAVIFKIFWWLSSYSGWYLWCNNNFSVDGHHFHNYFHEIDDFKMVFLHICYIFRHVLMLSYW